MWGESAPNHFLIATFFYCIITFFYWLLFRSKLGGLGAWREFAANRWRSSGKPLHVTEYCGASSIKDHEPRPLPQTHTQSKHTALTLTQHTNHTYKNTRQTLSLPRIHSHPPPHQPISTTTSPFPLHLPLRCFHRFQSILARWTKRLKAAPSFRLRLNTFPSPLYRLVARAWCQSGRPKWGTLGRAAQD